MKELIQKALTGLSQAQRIKLNENDKQTQVDFDAISESINKFGSSSFFFK
jgi:arginine/lysine/ornithine decarboxylase